jgi:hypothetical protein
MNIESECPFWAQQRLCASGGCTVCRCDSKDIPSEWSKIERTDRIKHDSKGVDQWGLERSGTGNGNDSVENGIWHVEDVENDKGEYFDIDLNKEAFTGYDGRHIWNLIYKENCFSGKF